MAVVGGGSLAVTSNCNELVPHRAFVKEHEVTTNCPDDPEPTVSRKEWENDLITKALTDDSRVGAPRKGPEGTE